jgi:hypothetical protein
MFRETNSRLRFGVQFVRLSSRVLHIPEDAFLGELCRGIHDEEGDPESRGIDDVPAATCSASHAGFLFVHRPERAASTAGVAPDAAGPRGAGALAWNYAEPFFFVLFLGNFGRWVMNAAELWIPSFDAR